MSLSHWDWRVSGCCLGGWNRETAWQGCVMCVFRWVFPLDFWRKSRTKRSFCRLWRVSFWGSLVRNARFGDLTRNPLRRACVSSVRNAGESAICPMRAQSSAEIVRVECAKCRRACDLSHARATLCGDRACRVREMQARVRFNCPVPAPPSAEIVRVERAKCRRALATL